jgi:choline transport protein
MKQHTRSGSFITDTSYGTSGWSYITAWFLGISNAMYAYGGTDGGKYFTLPNMKRSLMLLAIHISEEMPSPGRRVPQVMSVTIWIGLLSSVPLIIALLFSITNLDAVASSPLPSLEIIYQASVFVRSPQTIAKCRFRTGSRTATAILSVWLLVVYIGRLQTLALAATLTDVVCLSLQFLTAGRLAWAFARDVNFSAP